MLHATTWAVPPHRGPLVVTVHDLAFLRDPGHFTPHGNRFFRRAMSVVRDEADAVVVPSRATAEDCLRAGFEAGRLHVVPHGVAVPTPAPDEVARWRAGHGLTRPYLLWTGTLEPRKNLPTLLAAFGAVAAERSDLDLVLVGPAGWGGADAAVRAALAELPQGRVHALGRLPTAALHLAYAGAHALGFPSTWEGFGLPVLEAMAHGVPVVTSAGTSMAEVCGDAGILVDPRSADELAAGLLAAAGPRHDELATAARARASEFTWESSAERHVAAYRAAAGT
ncbi:MAG TPA: glycosyltransferase family 1 protein [Actinotalea sp.]|nr:glycosyltransferase family 1 protein [Actinotalea sp.]